MMRPMTSPATAPITAPRTRLRVNGGSVDTAMARCCAARAAEATPGAGVHAHVTTTDRRDHPEQVCRAVRGCPNVDGDERAESSGRGSRDMAQRDGRLTVMAISRVVLWLLWAWVVIDLVLLFLAFVLRLFGANPDAGF